MIRTLKIGDFLEGFFGTEWYSKILELQKKRENDKNINEQEITDSSLYVYRDIFGQLMKEEIFGLIMTSLNPDNDSIPKEDCIILIKSIIKTLKECNIKIPVFLIKKSTREVISEVSDVEIISEDYILSTNYIKGEIK